MNYCIKLAVFSVCLAVSTPLLADQRAYPSTEAELEEEVAKLPWRTDVGAYRLAASRSELRLSEGLLLLMDEAAERFMYLSQGIEYEAEAVVLDPQTFAIVFFEHVEAGYVTLSDWDEIDPTTLLDQIYENTNKANEERRKLGLGELHVVGWRIKPTLDRERNFVYWAIDAIDEGGPIVNSVALKLGREGFEKLTWVGPANLYAAPSGLLQAMIDAHQYDPGYKYADYSIGDKVAAFGIAALVSASAGGKTKVGKTALAAIGLAILAVVKKFIMVPILIGVGVVGAIFRRITGSNNPPPTST